MVSREMTIGEVIAMNENNIEVLKEFGMRCVGCPSAQGETLEQATIVHGLSLEAILEALNK